MAVHVGRQALHDELAPQLADVKQPPGDQRNRARGKAHDDASSAVWKRDQLHVTYSILLPQTPTGLNHGATRR